MFFLITFHLPIISLSSLYVSYQAGEILVMFTARTARIHPWNDWLPSQHPHRFPINTPKGGFPLCPLWENYGKIMGKTMASHDSDPSDLIFVPWGPEFVTSVAKFPSTCGTRRVRPPCARGSSLRAKRLCSELGTWQSSCAVQIIVPCIGGNLWESYVWYILSLLPTMWWYNYIIYNTTWWQMNMYNYIVCNHIYIYNYLYIYIYTWLSAMMAYDWHHSCHSCHPMASLAPPSAVASPAATTPSFPSFPRRPRRPPWRPRRPPWRFGRHGLPGESVNALGKWWKNGWKMGEDWVNNGGVMPKRLGISNFKAQKLDISPRTWYHLKADPPRISSSLAAPSCHWFLPIFTCLSSKLSKHRWQKLWNSMNPQGMSENGVYMGIPPIIAI